MEGYTPQVRRRQILVQDLPDEVLVYDLESNEVHCLNGTAARVWALCDGEKTVSQIARLAVSDEVEPDVAETLVWVALDQFAERQLLENPIERPTGMTRRQMVLRLGLAVGLTLPIVESIASPPAAMAQSGTTGMTGATPTPVV